MACVDSGGLSPEGGRSPPELALKVAAALGFDLARHRSLPVSVSQIRRADCVLVMDRLTVVRAWRRFPDVRAKLFLLDAPHEIPDPYGKPEHVFHEVFEQICRSVERLAHRCMRGG
jgi:protein-tyrosine-phosphatase